jgi:hypothetical protein
MRNEVFIHLSPRSSFSEIYKSMNLSIKSRKTALSSYKNYEHK